MAIEVQAYSHPWSHGNFVDSLAAGHLAEVLEADTLVGYFVAMVGVDELHLLNLTIAPRWQRRGHGLALLDVVLRHALSRTLATVWLEVRASNAAARALYARRGFAEVGQRRGYYPAAAGREDAVVMRYPVPVPVPVPAPQPAPQPAAAASAGAAGWSGGGAADALE
jgi:ribosomal-protein-alanine N-acetyltransferase